MPHINRMLGASKQPRNLATAGEAATRPPAPSPFQAPAPAETPSVEPIETDPKRRAALDLVRRLRGIAGDIDQRCRRAIEREKSLHKRRQAEECLREWLQDAPTLTPWTSPPHVSQVAGLFASLMSALPPLAEATVASYVADEKRSLPETALLRVLYRRIEALPLHTYAYLGSAAIVQHRRYETDGATLLTDAALLTATDAIGPPAWQEWAGLAAARVDVARRYLALRNENNIFEQRHVQTSTAARRQLEGYAQLYDACIATCKAASVQQSRWPPAPSTMHSYFDTDTRTEARDTRPHSPHQPSEA